MYKKAKSLILLAIIVAASVVSAISLPQSASAATANLYLADEMIKTDRQIALRNSLALCATYEVTTILGSTRSFGPDRGDEVSRSDLASGNWFYDRDDEPKARAGAIVDPDNGTVECRNLFKGRNVAKELGYGSNIELACAIGLKRTDGSNCLTGDGDTFTAADTNAGDIYNVLDRKLGIANYNDAQLYVLAAATYITTCGGKAVINVEDANPDQVANTDKYDTVTVVTGTGSTKKVLYTKKNNDKVGFRNLNDEDFTYFEENCDWMVEEMGRKASKYADWVKAHPAENGDNAGSNVGTGDENEEEEDATTCSVAVVGWIICPIVNNLLAPITDAAYAFVSALLTVQPLATDTTGGDNQIYTAWTVMRDFANVAFVIVFLLIVFSQLTNIGINNYGIKKMLPRLILAAVLVNVSYWICAIAVDLSNIAGASMKGLFADTAGNITIPDGGSGSTAEGAAGWVSLAATGLVATGAALYIGLSALLPALIIVLFTILITAITLLIRQVLIVLLIVVSPLAFVAYLLPNTESLFTKWRKLFGTLLLVFPIVGAIFGASELASKVITAAAPETEYTFAFQVMGAATAVIPLVLVPAMVKGTRALGGVIGGRFGNFLNNPNKGPVDRLRKGAEGYRQNREEYRKLKGLNKFRTLPGKGFATRRSAQREAVLANRRSELSRANASYVAGMAEGDEGFRAKLARGGGEGAEMRSLASAINVQAELQAKEVKAASAVIEHMNLSSDDLNSLAQGNNVTKDGRVLYGGDEATRTAAIQSAVKKGTVGDVESLVKSAGTMSETQRKALADAMGSSDVVKKATHLGGQTLDDIAQGNVTTEADLDRVMVRAINGGKYSADKLADNDKDSLKRMANLLNTPRSDMSTQSIGTIRQMASDLSVNDRLKTRVQESAQPYMDRIKANTPPTQRPNPTPPPNPGPTPTPGNP